MGNFFRFRGNVHERFKVIVIHHPNRFLWLVQVFPADVNADLLIINLLWPGFNVVENLWMHFFLLFLQHHSCLTPQTDIFWSFTWLWVDLRLFACVHFRLLQSRITSGGLKWGVIVLLLHCENVPLSRLLEVILGNSFQCRKYLTEVQVAEASWLAEKVDYHISGEGYLLVSEMSQDGCPGGVSHSLLEGCRDGDSSFTTGEVFQQMCFPLWVHHRNVFTCRLGCDLECLGGSWQLPVGESKSTESQI